jgi:hypothetical protein
MRYGRLNLARAHGMWTYEPRQGRKAATVVCSTSAVVTLAFFSMQNEKLKIEKNEDREPNSHF